MLDSRRFALFAFVFCFSLLGPACSDDSTGPARGGDASGVEPFLQELPSWSEFSPPLEPSDEISGEGDHFTDSVDDTIYDCKTTPYSLTENPDKVVTLDPDANILWLGAHLQGKLCESEPSIHVHHRRSQLTDHGHRRGIDIGIIERVEVKGDAKQAVGSAMVPLGGGHGIGDGARLSAGKAVGDERLQGQRINFFQRQVYGVVHFNCLPVKFRETRCPPR